MHWGVVGRPAPALALPVRAEVCTLAHHAPSVCSVCPHCHWGCNQLAALTAHRHPGALRGSCTATVAHRAHGSPLRPADQASSGAAAGRPGCRRQRAWQVLAGAHAGTAEGRVCGDRSRVSGAAHVHAPSQGVGRSWPLPRHQIHMPVGRGGAAISISKGASLNAGPSDAASAE